MTKGLKYAYFMREITGNKGLNLKNFWVAKNLEIILKFFQTFLMTKGLKYNPNGLNPNL